MKKKPSFVLAATAAAFCLLSHSARGGESQPPLTPTLGKAGKMLVNQDFSNVTALPESWKAAKGEWTVADGKLTVKELEADKHAAVLSVPPALHDAVVAFEFELHGAKGLDLSFNYPKGHLWRVIITGEGLVLQKDKDKKDSASKAERMAEAKVKLEPGTRHTIQAEMAGSRIKVMLDDIAMVEASHADFDADKPGIRFVVKGESVVIDDVRAWELGE